MRDMLDQIMENFRKNGLLEGKITQLQEVKGILHLQLRFGELSVTFDLKGKEDIRLILAELMSAYAFLAKELTLETGKIHSEKFSEN